MLLAFNLTGDLYLVSDRRLSGQGIVQERKYCRTFMPLMATCAQSSVGNIFVFTLVYPST
jgi:hypothetical protein